MENVLSGELNWRADICGQPQLPPPWSVNREAELRALKADPSPLDHRKATAAAFIRKLANEPIKSAGFVERYERISEEMDKNEFAEIHGRLLGDLGFRWIPDSSDDVLKELVLALEEPERLVDRAA